MRLKPKYKALDYALSPIFCEERIKGRGKWLSWLVKGLEGAEFKDQRQSDLEKRYMDDAMGGGFSCCGARALGTQASVVVAHRLSSCGSRALERRLSSCGAQA